MSHRPNVLVQWSVLLLCLLAIVGDTNAQPMLQDNFDSYPVNQFPPGWSMLFSGYGSQYQVVAAVADAPSPPNAFKLEGACNWASESYRLLPSVPDKMRLELRVKVDNPLSACLPYQDAIMGFFNYPNHASTMYGVGFAAGMINNAMPFQYGTWYNIRVELDKVAKTYSAWVNGQQVVADQSYPGLDPNAVFLTAHNKGHTRVWYDDVVVTDIVTSPSHDNPDFAGSRCFNGTDDYVRVVDNPSVRVGAELSVEAWVKLADLPRDGHHFAIVSKWTDPHFSATGVVDGGWILVVNGSNDENQGKLLLHIRDGHGFSSTALIPGNWYHIAATVGAGIATFYINGVLDNAVSVGYGLDNTDADLTIGAINHHFYNSYVDAGYFHGEMDEVRVSNRLRLPHEFSLYAPGLPDANTMALWHMDDPPGTTVADASGNGNNGTAHGGGCDTQPSSEAFCDNFDDGTGWQSRWTISSGSQALVSSPTHLGSPGALRLYGTWSNCGSGIYRSDFLADFGEYSAWFRHENSEAEPRLYVMVDPGNTSVDPVYRQCYLVSFSASNASHQFGLRIFRGEPNNQGVLLKQVPSQFPMNEWVRGFIRVKPDGNIVAGYDWSGGHYETECLDNNPNPITSQGLFLLWTCAPSSSPSNVYDDVCFSPLPATRLVNFDIKPGSCPNPLNLKASKMDMGMESGDFTAASRLSPSGLERLSPVLPVAVLGTSDFDVAGIDPMTVTLEGVSALRWNKEDVSTPVGVTAECTCNTLGADGYGDLTLKFDRAAIIEALGEVYDGDIVALTVIGQLYDGTAFEGSDCVMIIGNSEPLAGNESSEATQSAILLGNYPNPFNPTTEISFSLPNASDVKLEVYNVMGQRVATLAEGFFEAGQHAVIWSANDAASGVYFYRLTAGKFVETKKMMLLK